MSGGLPCSASGILVVNCSFWIGTFLIVTPGCDASNDLITLFHTVRSCPEVALFHHVSVTAWADDVLLVVAAGLDELDPPLPHAAAAVVAAARATAASARLLRMKVISRRGWPEADRRTCSGSAADQAVRKFLARLSTCRHRRIALAGWSTPCFHCVTCFFSAWTQGSPTARRHSHDHVFRVPCTM